MRFHKDPPSVAELIKDEKALVDFGAKVEVDFHYFSEVVMGYHDMNEVHKEVCEFVQKDKHKSKLILLPRLTFKSSVITQGYSLWRIFKDENIRILIYSDSTPKAQGFLRGVKNHIEGRAGRSLWKSHLGDWKGDLTWNELQATVSKRSEGSVEPTIDTSGIEASKVGMHYDLIIFDDIVSDVNVTNKQQMDKVYDCYKKSLSLLKRNGETLIVGTRWHYGDMYGHLIAENEERDEFGVYIKSAEETREDGGLIFDNIGEESLTQEHLTRLREAQGSYVYSCLYCNNPVDDEESLFKQTDFEFYGRIEESEHPLKTGKYEGLFITCTLDPAGLGEDKTGGVVCGTDKDMKIYVLEVLNRHLQPNQMVDWVIEMNYKYFFRRFGIETKFFRGMLRGELQKRVKVEQAKSEFFTNFRIDEFSPSRGETKFIRISALQPYHERGDLLFPGRNYHTLKKDFGELAWQMTQVTPTHMPEPNDLVDALANHIPLIQAGGIVKKTDIPKNSPAYLEQQWIKSWNKVQRHLPRRRRIKYKTCLS